MYSNVFKETVGSVSVDRGILLANAISMGKDTREPITGLQLVLDESKLLTPGSFAGIIYAVLDLQCVPVADEIGFNFPLLRNEGDPEIKREKQDRDFALELGYVTRQIGFATAESGKLHEAWIDQALIPTDSPLAHPGDHLHFDTKPLTNESALLVRFALLNKSNSLAVLATALSKYDIDFFAYKQAEVDEKDKYGRMTFLLKPCGAEQLHDAISAAVKLGYPVEARYRVIGYQGPPARR